MTISDSAGNALVAGPDATGPMLGFIEPPAPVEVLALRMYDFLIRPIRTADVTEGQLFLERYLQGPQEVWETIQTDIFRLLDLWDVNRILDAHLKFQKNIVGWTPELERPITDRLDFATLRRLISLSVPLWKIRGIEDAYIRAILALVLTRMRVWNWFDLRWILDETAMGEDHQGRDPYLLATVDEQFSDIRIVDGVSGLDRTLLLNMLKVFRPSGERLNVYWIDFLDQFLVDTDDTQWESDQADPIPVVDRLMTLDDDASIEKAHVITTDSTDWEDYVGYWRVRGTGDAATERFGVMFYWQDDDNYYQVLLEPSTDSLLLVERKSAAEATLVTVDLFATAAIQVYEDVFYGLRIHAEAVPTGTRVRVYLDGEERIDFIDTTSPLTRGSIGVIHLVGSTLDLNETELFQLPLASNLIDINEAL